MREAESRRVHDSLQREARRAEREAAERAEEERLMDLEAAAHHRIEELRLAREEEARAREHRADLASRQTRLALEAKATQEAWKVEDEERLLSRTVAQRGAQKRMELEESRRQSREVERAHLEGALHHESQVGRDPGGGGPWGERASPV